MPNTIQSSFILSSDFATLKNNANGSGSITVLALITIPTDGIYYYVDVNIGTSGAIARGRIRSSQAANKWLVANAVDYNRTGPNGDTYSIFAFMWRPSATVLRFQVAIPNPYNAAFTASATAETIDFYANTFLPPFV